MSKTVAEFAEAAIYLDTMLPYALLRAIDPAAKVFFTRIESGEMTAYTSVLTFDELAYRLLLALIKDRYPGSPLDRLRANEEKLIAEFGSTVATQLHHLRNFPNITIVELSIDDIDIMNEGMTKHHIRPRDALHFAAMSKAGCFNLASNDHHFDRIALIRRFTL